MSELIDKADRCATVIDEEWPRGVMIPIKLAEAIGDLRLLLAESESRAENAEAIIQDAYNYCGPESNAGRQCPICKWANVPPGESAKRGCKPCQYLARAEAEKAQLQAQYAKAQLEIISAIDRAQKLQARVEELEAEPAAQRGHIAHLESKLKQAGEDSRMLDSLLDLLVAEPGTAEGAYIRIPMNGHGYRFVVRDEEGYPATIGEGETLRDCLRAAIEGNKI